jgi:predicted nucleic acid-binding protein
MACLIDSDVLIDISREMPEAIEYVDSLPSDWTISRVTAMELIAGARDKRELADLDVSELLKSYSKSFGRL